MHALLSKGLLIRDIFHFDTTDTAELTSFAYRLKTLLAAWEDAKLA